MQLSGVIIYHHTPSGEIRGTDFLVVAHGNGEDSLPVMIHDKIYNDERGYSVAEVCDPINMLLNQYDGVAVCGTESSF
jgi:hypothetical protein